MAGTSSESESLLLRIRQLERAGLEQEIETLKGELSAYKTENENLQEELSEAYRMKSQMADLHRAEVTKNLDAERQLKFFQGCIAVAFAERDQSIMEAEKAKEKEDIMFQKFNDMEKRMEGLNLECIEQKKLLDQLQIDLTKQREYNEMFQKVVGKFYQIRQQSFPDFEDESLDNKCLRLLEDSGDAWSYNDKSTFKYIVPIKPRPVDPILTCNLDISKFVAQRSYFGFSASTGTSIELKSVLRWNLAVEVLPDGKGLGIGLTVALCIGGAILAALLIGSFILEFSFKDLKRASDDFNEKNKLGHGGFGVVYRGVLPDEERTEIAVKRFLRNDMKSKDDFLAELVIINQLCHKHLVGLYGWCHENGSLLLVYEYMPSCACSNCH
ncbi:hypothetical protein MLD38_023289 [Melastoma candidum]|uniref:Uncharacterized protein n=1 Tax=Melastoma candidum TaxID=119954 RepID=A0ACB9QQZ5_9MYRT|nr:hypothetical protein MLD38_023289 [Melastoma candidum]